MDEATQRERLDRIRARVRKKGTFKVTSLGYRRSCTGSHKRDRQGTQENPEIEGTDVSTPEELEVSK